jgi:hypothetical protein
MERFEASHRIDEIREEIKGLTEEAMACLRKAKLHDEADAAKGYWYAHILTALDDDHSWAGGGTLTMARTVERIENKEEE